MKESLIEIRSNLQEKKSRIDEAKNQINHLEHKEAKTTNQKRIQKMWIVQAASGTTSGGPIFAS